MNVGIVAVNNICFSPYIFFYTQLLDKAGINYELIYPDRHGIQEDFCGVSYKLKWEKNRKTAINYAFYYKQAIKIIKQKKYDALILLFSNSAVYMSYWVKKYYKDRYIIDIRDYTHENNKLYYFLEKKAIDNSLINVISSKKFEIFLPKSKYQVCHNISVESPYKKYEFFKRSEPITIGYMGLLGYKEQCKNLIELVGKDERFRLCFYGYAKMAEELKEYVEKRKLSNIVFYGRYTPDEKQGIIEKTDIIFNAYGNSTYLVKCAVSNKFYDSIYYRKPILTSPQTYMTELSGMMAFPIDFKQMHTLDALYDWYIALDKNKIEKFCEGTFDKVLMENEKTKVEIIKALKNCKK